MCWLVRGRSGTDSSYSTSAWAAPSVHSERWMQYPRRRPIASSMGRNETNRVSRLLTDAREDGTIPWSWLVDETRSLEGWRTWADPEEYARREARSYCRDFWALQPVTVEVWSEKGTVRGVLAPVLEKYLVPFQAIHGFGSATAVHKAANSADDRPLHVLYVGDFDPSGMRMSEVDLPGRLAEYGGHHI